MQLIPSQPLVLWNEPPAKQSKDADRSEYDACLFKTLVLINDGNILLSTDEIECLGRHWEYKRG